MPIKTFDNFTDAVNDICKKAEKCPELAKIICENRGIFFGFLDDGKGACRGLLFNVLIAKAKECYPKKLSTSFGDVFFEVLKEYINSEMFYRCYYDKKDNKWLADRFGETADRFEEVSNSFSELQTVAANNPKLFNSVVSIDSIAVVGAKLRSNVTKILEKISKCGSHFNTYIEGFEFDDREYSTYFYIKPVLYDLVDGTSKKIATVARFYLKITPFELYKGIRGYEKEKATRSTKIVEYINNKYGTDEVKFNVYYYDDENSLKTRSEDIDEQLRELMKEARQALGI